MAILRWPKFPPGTALETIRAKLNELFAGNDAVFVGGDRAHDALNSDAELTTNVVDSATIAGKPALGVAVTYASEFMETFDAVPASWVTLSGTVSQTVGGTGQTGGKALRQTGSVSQAFPYPLPYDASKLHRLRCRAKNISGAGTFSFGLRAIDATGATLSTTAVAASAVVPGASYVEYTGWVKGFGAPFATASNPLAPSPMTAGTVAIQPYIVLNGGAPSGVMDLDYVSYERQDEEASKRTYDSLIPSTDTRYSSGARVVADAVDNTAVQTDAITARTIQANAITTVKLNAGAVTAAKIAAGTITANEIAAGTITANEIASNAITTAKIAAGAVTAAKITVSDLSAINASFSGTVTSSGTIATGAFTAAFADFDGNIRLTSSDAYLGQPWAMTFYYNGSGVSYLSPQTGYGLSLGGKLGFFSATPIAQPTVTGSRGGNAALANLLTALANLGLIVDSTT